MATLLNPFLRGLDANGEAVSGALLYVFEAGTSTPVTTYSDSNLATPQAQPLVANAAGEFEGVFVPSGTYKIRVADSSAVVLYENDYVRMADRPDDLPALDDEAAIASDNTSYADGTVLFAIAETTYFEVMPSGETAYDLTNAAGEKLRYKNRHYKTPALLIESNETARGEGALWQADAYTYKEAASGATDQHLTTASGVKLYVLSNDGGYNVRAFGAVADYDKNTGAGTDDSAIFNLAVARAKADGVGKIVIPTGSYLISTSINATNIFAGIIFEGDAGYKISGAVVGSRLYGNTGDGVPVIDFLGTQHGWVRGCAIISADLASDPSTVGVMFARSTTSQYAQFCGLDDCTIDIATDTTANSGLGSIAVCNVAAEIFTIRDSYCLGDTGLYFGSSNHFGVSSDYQTQGGPVSCSTLMIEGNTVLHSYDAVGTPMQLRSAVFVNGSAYCNAGGTGSTHAFRMYGICKGLKLQIFPEFAERVGIFPTTLEGSDIEILGVYDADKYIETPAGFSSIINCNITFGLTVSGAFTSPDYWIAGNSTDTVENVKIVAPAAPAVAYVAPVNEVFNLKCYEFQGATDTIITRKTIKSRSSTYSDRPYRMGRYDFWIDAYGMLRQEYDAPTSDTDGLPLAKIVAVPASATASGAPGQIARNSSYIYIYTGDGSTHTWVRSAAAAW